MKKIHYAWIILISASAINFGGLGTLFNASGIFFPSVTKELGIGLGDISLYMTIMSLCLVVTAPIVGKLLPKIDVRIMMSTAFIICLLTMASMSQFTEVWQWYVSGAIIGAAGSFIFYIPIPIILGNWFQKKLGFALGIAGSFTGFGGAIMNPLISSLIENYGWRHAYLMTAIIVGVTVLPFTMFLVRFKPEDKGLKPYGYMFRRGGKQKHQPNLGNDVSVKVAITSVVFVLVMLVASLSGLTSGLNQLLASFGDSIGLSATLAASLVSVSMISNVVCKCLFGAASDWIGIKKTLIISILMIGVGFSLFFISNGNYAVLLIAAALYGIHAPVIVVGLPLFTRELFGAKSYSKIFPYVSMGQTFIKGFSFALFGFVFDLTNSYAPVFLIGMIVCIAMLFFTISAFKASKKLADEKVHGKEDRLLVESIG